MVYQDKHTNWIFQLLEHLSICCSKKGFHTSKGAQLPQSRKIIRVKSTFTHPMVRTKKLQCLVYSVGKHTYTGESVLKDTWSSCSCGPYSVEKESTQINKYTNKNDLVLIYAMMKIKECDEIGVTGKLLRSWRSGKAFLRRTEVRWDLNKKKNYTK